MSWFSLCLFIGSAVIDGELIVMLSAWAVYLCAVLLGAPFHVCDVLSSQDKGYQDA